MKQSRNEAPHFALSEPRRRRASPEATSAAARSISKLEKMKLSSAFFQKQMIFGGSAYRRVFPVIRGDIRRVIDETAGDLTLQRGLLGTQSLIIHVVYKHKDIQLPSRTAVLWLDFKTRTILYSTCIIVRLIRMLLKDVNGVLEVLVDVVVQGGLDDKQGIKRFTCEDTK